MTLPLLMPPVRATIGPSVLVVDGRSAAVTVLPRTASGELTLRADASFVIALHPWLSGWIGGWHVTRPAELITYDARSYEIARSSFAAVRVTSISFPPLDVDSSEPAFVTVRLQVAGETATPGSRRQANAALFASRLRWLRRDFRLLTEHPFRVTRISAVVCPAPNMALDIKVRACDYDLNAVVELSRYDIEMRPRLLFGYPLPCLFELQFTSKVTQVWRDPRADNPGVDRLKLPLDFALSVRQPLLSISR
jgi:hypothetical protein